MSSFNQEIFQLFDKQWALATAGTIDDYNTMTISWGGLGTLWGKSVATIYVKPIRYTYQYLESNDYFTISFYPESLKKDLLLLGSLSGRDGNKINKTCLHGKAVGDSVTFEEAEITLLCKKIFWQDLDLKQIPTEIVDKYYQTEAVHRIYIGEVIDIIKKQH